MHNIVADCHWNFLKVGKKRHFNSFSHYLVTNCYYGGLTQIRRHLKRFAQPNGVATDPVQSRGKSVFKSGLCPLGGDISQLPQLLLCVCETVKDEAVALRDSTRLLNQTGSAAEDEDSMETDCPRSSQRDQRDGVSAEQHTCTLYPVNKKKN